jgi:putative ABC transport system permease protein
MVGDFRFALRLLRKHPGFTVAAVLTLALGIGANTAIYSVINAVLLRPAPVEALDRLVMVWETDRVTGTTREPASVPDYLDFLTRVRTLAGLSALAAGEANLNPSSGDPERLLTLSVSHDMLPLLGIKPVAGRGFSEEEDRAHGPSVVLISESLSRRLFNAQSALGQTLRLDEEPSTVIGVVPDATDFGVLQMLSAAAYSRSFADRGEAAKVDVWRPLQPDPRALPRETHPIFLVGRLASGASRDTAQSELTAVAADLERTYPVNRGRGVNVEALTDVVFGSVRPILRVLVAAVLVVLLIACVNVANLLLARGAARAPEVAVRTAVGASWTRLLRQFLTESFVFTLIAALAGVVVAYAGMRALLSLAPADIPRLSLVTLDGSVLGATLVVTAVVAITFGLVPTIQARRLEVASTLKDDGGARSTGDRDRSRVRGALVVAELAAAVMLLSGSGLLIRSFWKLQHVETGFHPEGVLKAEFQLPRSRYPVNMAAWPDFKEQHAFLTALQERAAQLPGVVSVAIAGNHPLDPGFTNSFRIVGREAEATNWPEISVRRVSAGYFRTVGLPLKTGRLLAATDTLPSQAVAVINEAAARRFFAGLDPIGAQIRFWGVARTIVGVVGDEKFQGLSGEAPIAVYVATAQAPAVNGAGVLLVKTAGDPALLAQSVRTAIRAQDPMLAVFGLEPLEHTVSRSVSQRRFAMLLVTAFASVALLLAAIGVYGVLSYDVALRRREIGIRLALGAEPARILKLIVAQALTLVGVALALGGSAALGLTKLLASLLFGVSERDPLTLAAVAIVLTLVAFAASAIPAWRASRTDPATALRAVE